MANKPLGRHHRSPHTFEINPYGVFQTIIVPLSFETGEIGALRVRFTKAVQVMQISGMVVKALAGTDAGTIVISSEGGVITTNTLTYPLSSALGVEATEGNIVPSGANATIAINSFFDFTTAKTTAGGKVAVSMVVKSVQP